MMGGYGAGMSGGGWVFMGLFWVVLVGAVVWLVVELGRSAGRRRQGATTWTAPPTGFAPAAPTPQQVLDRRLAAGEIDMATYQTVRAALADGGAR